MPAGVVSEGFQSVGAMGMGRTELLLGGDH